MPERDERTVYMVEKFVPTQCPNPKCFNEFRESGADGYFYLTYWMHEPKEVTEKIRESIGGQGMPADLIVCAKCRNITLRLKLEDAILATREEAEVLLNEGFANLREMRQSGTPQLGRFRILRPDELEALLEDSELPGQAEDGEEGHY